MGHILDTYAAITAQLAAFASALPTQSLISGGLGLTLLVGYWIMSLLNDRHHRWRRDRGNLSRIRVWRCKRCGAVAASRSGRTRTVCGA